MRDVAKAKYECFVSYSRAYICHPKYNNKKGSPKYNKTGNGN